MSKFLVRTTQPVWVDFFHEIEADHNAEAEELVEEGHGEYVGFSIGENFTDCEVSVEVCAPDTHIEYAKGSSPE